MANFLNGDRTEDRRQFRRIKINSPIEYKFLNSQKFRQTVSCDISEGGISFMVDSFVPVGTYLYFHVRLRNRPQPLYGIARIVWSSKEPYSEKYRVGLEFTEVGSISRQDIYTIIEENKAGCFSS